jgi:hypothetical protein
MLLVIFIVKFLTLKTVTDKSLANPVAAQYSKRPVTCQNYFDGDNTGRWEM